MNHNLTTVPSVSTTAATFNPARAMHVLMVTLMAGSVAWSIAQLLNWFVALPIGLALTYTFSIVAKRATAPFGTISRLRRAASGLTALAILGVTVGLSYGSIYANLFAETSALNRFEGTRLSIQRPIEQLISNAQTVENTFKGWSDHSSRMKAIEENKGGSCPNRSGSNATRGPIAIWRDAESSTAQSLHSEISTRVSALKAKFDGAKERKPKTFRESQEISSDLNAALELGENLARGAYLKTTRETLQRQLDAEIAWPNHKFKCGDAARDELLERSIAALNQLEKSPSLEPLSPAIDLSNRQDIAARALIRSFNGLLKIGTVGLMGSFADDPLMQAALDKGWVNRETLPFGLAALLEICVLLTGAIAERIGPVVSPYQPLTMLAEFKQKAHAFPRWWQRALAGFATFLARAGVNLFYVLPTHKDASQQMDERAKVGRVVLDDDPVYPQRALGWATVLLSYWFPMHEGDFIVIPNGRSPMALTAARALTYQNAAVQLSHQCEYSLLTAEIANRLQKLIPNPGALSYAVFRLEPGFAQALRIHVLNTGDSVSAGIQGRSNVVGVNSNRQSVSQG